MIDDQRKPLCIDYLADVPAYLPVLARAVSAHWTGIIPGESVAGRQAKLETHQHKSRLPVAWVAHRDGQPLGISALRVCDLAGYEALTPWLAGVFVMPEARGQSIASRLCGVAEHRAAAWGVQTLYLHTPDQQSLYKRLGWRFDRRVRWHDIWTDIMVKSCTDAVAEKAALQTESSRGQ